MEVDPEVLSKRTFQDLVTPPEKRRVSDLVWAPVIERNFLAATD